jgi:hypothetical protein
LDIDEVTSFLDERDTAYVCAIADFLAKNEPEWWRQLARVLDARLDRYPISSEKTGTLLKEIGIQRGTTTVRKHRAGGCAECQSIFARAVD